MDRALSGGVAGRRTRKSHGHCVRACAATGLARCVATVLAGQVRPAVPPVTPPAFEPWLADLIEEAISRGFNRGLVTEALGGLQPVPGVLQADRAQAGPSPGLDAYLAQRLTPTLIARGRERMRDHRALLGRIERWFGVQRRFIVATWGAETGDGPYTGDVPVLQTLATLAWEPRRATYFRAELFDALRIV